MSKRFWVSCLICLMMAVSLATVFAAPNMTSHDNMKMNEAKSLAKDPVCGMNVDPATALYADFEGERFYFCCDRCRQKFLSKPADYKTENKSGS